MSSVAAAGQASRVRLGPPCCRCCLSRGPVLPRAGPLRPVRCRVTSTGPLRGPLSLSLSLGLFFVARTHTHTHIYVYIYIYICVYVCVCVYRLSL